MEIHKCRDSRNSSLFCCSFFSPCLFHSLLPCLPFFFLFFFSSSSPSLFASVSLPLSPLELLKYAKYLEGYSIDGVRHVYKKACTIHLPKKPAVHLLWAAFEEQQGKVFLSVCSLFTFSIQLVSLETTDEMLHTALSCTDFC